MERYDRGVKMTIQVQTHFNQNWMEQILLWMCGWLKAIEKDVSVPSASLQVP